MLKKFVCIALFVVSAALLSACDSQDDSCAATGQNCNLAHLIP